MMLLSRFWYAVLGLLLGVGVYVVYLGAGQYNRRNAMATTEELASDSQVVGWALQIDARRRIDALLIGALDKSIQDSLVAAAGKEKIPARSREDAQKALVAVAQKLPPASKSDALFAVDRDGRVVAQVGFDQARAFEDFELGGYAAVNDALHGYLRDDTWVLGGKLYRVAARPVEFDAAQPPAGALVGLVAVDPAFAKELSRRTRTNLAFFAGGQRVTSAGMEGFDEGQFEQIAPELVGLGQDKAFLESGRSDVRDVGAKLATIFARLPGEAWELGGGFAVVRSKIAITSPMGFMSGADDKDKASVNWAAVAGVTLVALLVGLALSYLEHTVPLDEMVRQAARLKRGEVDALPVPRFRGAYRSVAHDINAGIERVMEKGGGVRKQADLESILGPVPVQPAMKAFSFSLADGAMPVSVPPNAANLALDAASRPGPDSPVSPGSPPAKPPPPPSGSGLAGPLLTPVVPARAASIADIAEDEETTMIGQVPPEVLAQAAEQSRGDVDAADWLTVFEDFLRTKKKCGEPIEGLTFEKFQQTLRKNNDQLIQRHGCRRVRFTVYVKDGRASLKATPVRE